MPISLKSNVTVFISVRKGLEAHLLKEIQRNKTLNNIKRIHHKRVVINNIDHNNLASLSGCKDLDFNADILNTYTLKTDNKWICKYNTEKVQDLPKSKHSVSIEKATHTIKRENEFCDIHLQSGGLEVKCTFEWLIKGIVSIKSAESIWLRVGYPFRANNEKQLTHFISELPWNLHISPDSVYNVPLRIISRNSALWSGHIVSRCVRDGLKLFFERTGDVHLNGDKVPNLDPLCISVTLNRNTCYVAIQCSGRLSPRIFNLSADLVDNLSIRNWGNSVPYWSLTKHKAQLHLENIYLKDSNCNHPSDVSIENRRKLFIENQKLISNDNCDTTDSLFGAFLHNNDVFRTLKSKIDTIWDPFCGNCVLICEIISLLLSLPNFNEKTFPNVRILEKIPEYKTFLKKYMNTVPHLNIETNIVGSDTSHLKLVEASDKLAKFSSFHSQTLSNAVKFYKTSPFSEMQSLYGSYHKIPFVTLHNSPIEDISQYMRNTVIITKIPYSDLKGTDRLSTIRLYKKFGQIVGSRSDWVSVYVISRSHGFEYYTGLEWKTLAKCTNSSGGIIKLLKWSGKSRWFKTPEERDNQLNEFDFV